MREFELLARCCGMARGIPLAEMNPENRDFKDIDDEKFVALAAQHKVAGAAFLALKAMEPLIGASGLRELKRTATTLKAARSFLLKDWRSITEAFNGAGIPCLTLKGPASSLQLYGDALTREYGDLDLLVDLPELSDIVPVMAALGYALDDALPESGTANHPLMQKIHHLAFHKNDRPSHVEIHGRTWTDGRELYRESLDALFSRSVSVEYDGIEFRTLRLADQAVFLIAHGVMHAWCLLHWVLDVAVLLNRKDEALHRDIAGRIAALGMERQLKLTVEVIRSLYPVDLPEPLAALVRGVRRSLAGPLGFSLDRLHQGGRDMGKISNILLLSSKYLMPLTSSPGKKLAVLVVPWLISPVDVDRLHLPKYLLFLHFPLRPLFALGRRLRRLREKRKVPREA